MEECKKHYVLIKDFSTFIYDHTLHCGSKNFCGYCLQVFSAAEILKCHINDCFKTNGKQRINMPKKGKYGRFQNCESKDLKSFLMTEDNRNQNPDESIQTNTKSMLLAAMVIS